MPERHAVIMAGGGGARLWPASSSERPKQLLPDVPAPGQTLLGATMGRLDCLVPPARTWIVTTAPQVAGIRRRAPEVPPEQILVEPEGRNTAPCLALAARHIARRAAGRAITLIALPADQHVRDAASFRRHLAAACAQAEARDTVATLGITPDRPETGYGYMERGDQPLPAATGDDGVPAYPALRFVEKPDPETAARYLAGGRHLWNAGIFCVPLARLEADFERLCPRLWTALEPVAAALQRNDGTVGAATETAYGSIEAAPIDVAVMERLTDIAVVPADVGWTDLGAWPSMATLGQPDAAGNVVLGRPDSPVELIDARDCLVWSEGARVGVIGLEGIAVVIRGDAVLVCPLDRAQEVRAIADAMARRAPREE